MGPQRNLLLRVRVNLGIISTNRYFTFVSSRELQPLQQMNFSLIPGNPFVGNKKGFWKIIGRRYIYLLILKCWLKDIVGSAPYRWNGHRSFEVGVVSAISVCRIGKGLAGWLPIGITVLASLQGRRVLADSTSVMRNPSLERSVLTNRYLQGGP